MDQATRAVKTQLLSDDLAAAKSAYRRHDYVLAFDLYSRLGEEGHVESQLMVAWFLLKGLGVAQDEAGAARWFERAAALGSPQGSFYYARYLTRLGRHQEARAHYGAAAQTGHLPSMFWLGYASARGKGAELNTAEGYRYLTQAARRGHMHALREIAMLDLQGCRGPLWRLLGVVEFCAAIIGAFILTFVDRESDRLRA